VLVPYAQVAETHSAVVFFAGDGAHPRALLAAGRAKT
jgi:hypothetical protein